MTTEQLTLAEAPAPSSMRTDQQLRELKVFNPEMLRKIASEEREYLVEGLLHAGSVNLVVGNSGLGKTALLASLGVAVASGKEWMGRSVSQGPVLYIDGEMPANAFSRMLDSLSSFAELPAPPADFYAFSPNWGQPEANFLEATKRRVLDLRPKLVIVDPLRVFWPKAETGSDEAVAMIKFQRELASVSGCSFLTLHHLRKSKFDDGFGPDLTTHPREWLQGAAGSHALINQTDTRLGIDAGDGGSDLVLGGFVRFVGDLQAMRLRRVHGDDGEPIGYEALESSETKALLQRLALTFRYADAKAALGGSSDSKTAAFLKQCEREKLLTKTGAGKNTRYHQVAGQALSKAA